MPSNVRLFLAFRVLFNARFYYPVIAVLFVDLGLTLDQYALLNVAWAGSIVAFELPLGAWADRIGRRPLIVGASALMIVEMAVLAFAPTGNATLLFWVFMVNRVLSGLAEAAASGADEALAYDSLCEVDARAQWPLVLSKLQYLMSGGFILSMLVGAAVYDPEFINGVFGTSLDQVTTARFPVYLTLAMAVGAFLVSLRMREPEVHEEGVLGGPGGIETGWQGIKHAASWIRTTSFAFALICFVLVLDSAMRLFVTMQSSYYRMIGIPESVFGVLGAAFAAMGFFGPRIARGLLKRNQPLGNFTIVALLGFGGLFGAAFSSNWIGVLPVVLMSFAWTLLNFFSSHYLNAVTDSKRRATVLSFRSLAGNLAYGAAGWGYALLFKGLAGGERPPSGSAAEEAVLAKSLVWIPAVFLGLALPLFLWAIRIPRMRAFDSAPPPP